MLRLAPTALAGAALLALALPAAAQQEIQKPKDTWQTPKEIQQPKGTWQQPGEIQVPKGIQAIRTQDEQCANASWWARTRSSSSTRRRSRRTPRRP